MKKRHHHNLDYYSYCSLLREWNSEFKVIFSLFALIFVIVADSVPVSFLTILFMGILTVGKGKIPFGEYVRLLKIPVVFIFMSGFAIAFQIGGMPEEAVLLPGGARLCVACFGTFWMIAKTGLVTACTVALKAFGAVSAMYMLTLSTPMGDILAVLGKLHVPSLIVELMHLIYRYIFLMSDIWHLQKDAARSRMGYHNYKSSLRSFAFGLSNLLVISLKRANACYDAMEARGYDGELRMLEEKHAFTGAQALVAVGYVCMCIAMLLFTAVLY